MAGLVLARERSPGRHHPTHDFPPPRSFFLKNVPPPPPPLTPEMHIVGEMSPAVAHHASVPTRPTLSSGFILWFYGATIGVVIFIEHQHLFPFLRTTSIFSLPYNNRN